MQTSDIKTLAVAAGTGLAVAVVSTIVMRGVLSLSMRAEAFSYNRRQRLIDEVVSEFEEHTTTETQQ